MADLGKHQGGAGGSARKQESPAPPKHSVSRALRVRSLVLASVVFLVLAGTYLVGTSATAWQNLETLGTVLRFKLRGEQRMSNEIRIVGISQQFIENVAKYDETYPFNRDLHAVVLRRLADVGAKVIVVDILFSEEMSWDDTEDGALRDAISYCREQGCEVVLAAAIEVDKLPGATAMRLVKPAPIIMEAQPHLGVSNVSQKLGFRFIEEGSFRLESESGTFDSQPVAAWYAMKSANGLEFKRGGPAKPYAINYSSQPATFPGYLYALSSFLPEEYSAEEWDLVNAERTALKAGSEPQRSPVFARHIDSLSKEFADKVVFYGSRNDADNDYFQTPFDKMFGVDTIAQSFDTRLRGKAIASISNPILLLFGLALGLLAWFMSTIRPIKLAVALGIGLLVVCVTVNFLLFVNLLNIPLAFTTASFLFPFLACTIYGGSVEEAERRKIRATFGRYMSDELVAQLVDDPSMANLGGQRLEVAVMFVDIRNYSTLTEHLDPQQTVWMLNTLLGEITEVIRTNDGFVDKYLGDGLLACFGGPVLTSLPANDAVAAALEMLVALHRDVNPRLLAVNLPELRIGIGIHYGAVVMGNIGSEARMDFTVVGDSVNVAARVESCTKDLGWAVLVTREVVEAAHGFEFEPVGEQQVKGREQAVELYRPVYAELGDRLRL